MARRRACRHKPWREDQRHAAERHKVAVIDGAGGALGSTFARTFARRHAQHGAGEPSCDRDRRCAIASHLLLPPFENWRQYRSPTSNERRAANGSLPWRRRRTSTGAGRTRRQGRHPERHPGGKGDDEAQDRDTEGMACGAARAARGREEHTRRGDELARRRQDPTIHPDKSRPNQILRSANSRYRFSAHQLVGDSAGSARASRHSGALRGVGPRRGRNAPCPRVREARVPAALHLFRSAKGARRKHCGRGCAAAPPARQTRRESGACRADR
jgi:hypothetical protein